MTDFRPSSPALEQMRALQLRSAQAVKEPPVHGSAVQRAQRASIGIGKNGFRSVLGR